MPTETVARSADTPPLEEAHLTSSGEVVGGGHTTIVTIAPTTEDHTHQPVGLGDKAETPTVVIDGVSSSGSTDAVGTMTTTVGTPLYSPSAPNADNGRMVVYPRKRGRKRKTDLGGHSSAPIHVPRQRGRVPMSSEPQEQSTPKRRGRPPKVLSQSMQAMTSQFEAHSMQQVGGATGGWGSRHVHIWWIGLVCSVAVSGGTPYAAWHSLHLVACSFRMWVWWPLLLGQMWGTLWPMGQVTVT